MAVNETSLINAAIQAGLISSEQVNDLRGVSRKERAKLLDIIMRECRMPETAFYQAIASLKDIPFLNADELIPDQDSMNRLPLNLLQRRGVVPVSRGDQFLLAMSDADDTVALESVRRIVGSSIKAAMADPSAISSCLQRLTGESVGANAEEKDPIQLLEKVMQQAYIRRSSDIHFEPLKDGMQIRLRVDGILQLYPIFFIKSEADALVNRIKVLANLDIAEQRIPQDGGFSYQYLEWNTEALDLRIATVPSRWGERITIRILGQSSQSLSLDHLGMPKAILTEFRKQLEKPFGMILVTGPTGSGKSTTLYGALRELDKSRHNVLSVEDPVEQMVEGVSQIQVSSKVSFSSALRSFLRHDPDVILVGEIRDKDTADIALKAAMTGHLVLSTLHTNTATAAPNRLVDIGCERYLVASTLSGVLAQRLMRRLCTQCKYPYEASDLEKKQLGITGDLQLYDAKGCPACMGSGYHGRVGLYEALWFDSDLTEAVSQGASEIELRHSAKSFSSLWSDAREKVIDGVLSLQSAILLRSEEEVLE
jgi:type II secretory ATPase GspE/PulE/Tfp pilus assembly ATPase PilB-like protein